MTLYLDISIIFKVSILYQSYSNDEESDMDFLTNLHKNLIPVYIFRIVRFITPSGKSHKEFHCLRFYSCLGPPPVAITEVSDMDFLTNLGIEPSAHF